MLPVRDEPDSTEGVSEGSEEPRDYQAEMRAKIPDFRGYDELAVDQYIATAHYLAMREAGVPLAQAAAFICQNHGHDAPRGLCRRCGLGIDLTDPSKQRDADRDARRQAYLAQRH
jgi:hypothetical protein